MGTPDTFQELMVRVMRRDPDAVAIMVDRYGQAILREVQMQLLTRSYLRRTIDPEDILQSVLAIFFLRIDLGELDLRNPAQLIALLREMARNRLRDKARQRRARRRDVGREQYGSRVLAEVPAEGDSPSHLVQYEELLEKAHDLLTPRELQIAQCRARGQCWDRIAADLGETPEGVRKQISRAIGRVVKGLGLGC